MKLSSQMVKRVLFLSLVLGLLSVAIPQAAAQDSQVFKVFGAQVVVNQLQNSSAVIGRFVLGDTSDGISPATENVSLQVGNIALAIPAGSFKRIFTGGFFFFFFLGGVKGGGF